MESNHYPISAVEITLPLSYTIIWQVSKDSNLEKRTRCPSFCQLNYRPIYYIKIWSEWQDSNLRPLASKASRLPLTIHSDMKLYNNLAGDCGVEPQPTGSKPVALPLS